MSKLPPPVSCAVCGADIPPRAKACPECGADELTGWREQSLYDGLDLPEEEPSGRRFAPVEFGQNPERAGKARLWWVTATVLLIIVGLLVFLNRF